MCGETNGSYKAFGLKPLEDPLPKQDNSNKLFTHPLSMAREVETVQWEDYPHLSWSERDELISSCWG